MSSQASRVNPYPTPRNRKTVTPRSARGVTTHDGLLGSTSNRSSAGSLGDADMTDETTRPNLGDGRNQNFDTTTGVTPPENISMARILAAVTSLSNKMDSEITKLYDKLEGDISSLSDKVGGELASLANKVDLDISEKIDEGHTTLSNKIDQLSAEVQEVASHPAPGVGAAPAAPAVPSAPWTYSNELREHVYSYAYESVAEATIAAYTATETPNGNVLVHSLYNTIKRKINDIDAPWPEQQLLPVINGVQDVAGTQAYNTLVRNAGKHARERLHHLVLYNIRNNPEGTVPGIKRLIHRIATHCRNPLTVPHVDILWAQTGWPQRLRVAYIRREAVRIFRSLSTGGAGGNIWKRVDRQLYLLSQEGSTYTQAFYQIIYNQDLERFNGQGYFEDIDPEDTFDLPSDEMVQEEIHRMEQPGYTGLQD
ncbi:hypothetical protein DFH28DRAFT_1183872 [Melampsora americana]|nr:hypothetical protein DFH28DRAFT_1183872 [Melampsora americana]